MASQDVKEQSCVMVAKLSSGMSGAELANVCNEAALLAGRRSAEVAVLKDTGPSPMSDGVTLQFVEAFESISLTTCNTYLSLN